MNQRSLLSQRASGLLLHPTSLPGPWGIGDLGGCARRFIDFLAASGQTWWQMLPVGPTDKGGCPYVSSSSFAGNPLLISLDTLVAEGILPPEEYPPGDETPDPAKVDFPAVRRWKGHRLREAFATFEAQDRWTQSGAEEFTAENDYWLADFALFNALKGRFEDAPWWEWPEELRRRQSRALERARRELARELRYERFVQWTFHQQWAQMCAYARKRGILFIGDLPIYVSRDSADVWAHADLFHLDSESRPEAVAGVPPDYFNADGQFWGNPLYRWEVLRARGYDWWIDRLRSAFERFDAVRLDHFIAFVRYWEVPAEAVSAKEGCWREGPGMAFFEAVSNALGRVELIAEDLGSVTPEVLALSERFNFPGMRVLQFAFDGDPENLHLPSNHPERCVVYTGTHDNDTTVGWFTASNATTRNESTEQISRERENALCFLGSDGREIHWDMIRAAFASRANIAIIPVQDVLGLGSEARMNRPGIPDSNWKWRMLEGALSPLLTQRLKELTSQSGRSPDARDPLVPA